ncbi:MAG TPA: hypothetical protein VF081_07505 [Solirubrobacterales bacterium]
MKMKLSVSETLGEIFAEYRVNAKQLVPLGFWFLVGPLILQVLGEGNLALTFAFLVVQLSATTIYRGVVVELIRRRREGGDAPGSMELVGSVLPIAAPMFIAATIHSFSIVIGFLLLIVPGVILITIWAVIAPAIVIERTGAIGSFKRSRALVRGNGMPVFGAILVVYVLVGASTLVAYGIIGAAIGGTLVPVVLGAIASAFITPLEGLLVVVLYYRLLAIESVSPAPEPPAELAPAES